MIRYEFDGPEYLTASSHQKEWGRRMIADLPLRDSETILDLGCGDGLLSDELAQRVPRGRVVGVDSSWNMIETARKHQRDNLHFQWMDIEHLQLEHQFGLVFSNAALHWIKDHRKMLHRLYVRLRPGGILRFNFAAEGNSSNLIAVLKDTMAQDRFAPFFRQFDWPWTMPGADEYRALIEHFEFSELNVWLENADRYFDSAQELIAWIDQPCLVPFMDALPERAKWTFRSAVVEAMQQRTRRPDGRYFETFRRINVFARK